MRILGYPETQSAQSSDRFRPQGVAMPNIVSMIRASSDLFRIIVTGIDMSEDIIHSMLLLKAKLFPLNFFLPCFSHPSHTELQSPLHSLTLHPNRNVKKANVLMKTPHQLICVLENQSNQRNKTTPNFQTQCHCAFHRLLLPDPHISQRQDLHQLVLRGLDFANDLVSPLL